MRGLQIVGMNVQTRISRVPRERSRAGRLFRRVIYMQTILISVSILGLTGLFAGVLLSFAGRIFAVAIDEKKEKIRESLPGINCGACGFAGCDGAAEAIAKKEAPPDICAVGGDTLAATLSELMGSRVEKKDRHAAFIRCVGSPAQTKRDYSYTGIESCAMAALVPGGGGKSCAYGCLGYGDCADVCPFGAILLTGGIARVDTALCRDCKKCIAACPKGLITEIAVKEQAADAEVNARTAAKEQVEAGSDETKTGNAAAKRIFATAVGCYSAEKGRAVRESCERGCIACRKCEKVCPADAIHVTDNLAAIDDTRCISCGKCGEVCPRDCICDISTHILLITPPV